MLHHRVTEICLAGEKKRAMAAIWDKISPENPAERAMRSTVLGRKDRTSDG